MRHRKGNSKLGKPTDQRIALLRSLVRELFINSRIKTTKTRARAAQRYADRIIALAKKGDLSSRRQALRLLPHKDILSTVFSSVSDSIKNREGGFTRVIPLTVRQGDAAQMAMLEIVQ